MEGQDYRIGCVLMAAGNSTRFLSNKLNAEFQGKTLYTRALDVIPAEVFYQVVVVTQYWEFSLAAKARGFSAILNEHPEAGLSHTIALGIGALQNVDAILFLVADQPLLRKQSIYNAITLHLANKKHIVAMAFGDRRGNPCMLSYAQDGKELVDVDKTETLYHLIR